LFHCGGCNLSCSSQLNDNRNEQEQEEPEDTFGARHNVKT